MALRSVIGAQGHLASPLAQNPAVQLTFSRSNRAENKFSVSVNVIEGLLSLNEGTLSQPGKVENKIIAFPSVHN